MKKTKHNNILQLHEIYEDDENVYIVMELIEGSELFDRIVEKGFYSERDAINIVKQIVCAVSYLHDIGVVHRDLKPENLLCSGHGENEIVKIADFGLSKFHSDEDKLMTSCGTPGYVAPEVLLSERYDKSVDMWGIGVITYILLAGYPPFYDENDNEDETGLFEKVINVEYDFEDECWDEISDLAKEFISALLQRVPSNRLTATQALEHPWLSSTPEEIDISKRVTRRMSHYNLRRKEQIVKVQEE